MRRNLPDGRQVRSRRVIALMVMFALGAATVAMVGGWLVMARQGRSEIVLTHISTAELRDAGLVLNTPTSTLRVSEQKAIRTTLKNYPAGATVLQVVLAQVRSIPGESPSFNKACWIVSVHPTGGSFTANGTPGKWELALVNAESGHWLFTTVFGV